MRLVRLEESDWFYWPDSLTSETIETSMTGVMEGDREGKIGMNLERPTPLKIAINF